MIIKYHCVNISSIHPKALVEFYNEILGIPIIEPDENYDGVSMGFIEDAPVIVIWDEVKWGKSSEGKVNFVFNCDDLDRTYAELKEKITNIQPPTTAAWGGRELTFCDPDGNKILLL
ncbi:VOC family protein ['Paenibacillus yunnanensis' Narsing Rao et al. 2020]|uniref:VOC family protein n=1 Tax=Paenibacillus tengchongensis TaxID=2608684 RepID=UPI00124E9E98|nr:VOC family protein [Paenibacillus tengchongensis]